MIKLKFRPFGALSFFLIGLCCVQNLNAEQLHLFAGAGLRQPIDHLVKTFEIETGHKVFIDYGGSGQLLTRVQASGKGDVFIPGSIFYIQQLKKPSNASTFLPIVQHTPVIGVNIKQSQKIKTFEDLAKPGVRLAMGDPKAMAFGRTAITICERSGMKDAIFKNVTVYGATVKQLAMYVIQGTVDASIIGRTDAFQNQDTISMIPIPADYFEPEIIAAAVLNTASNPDLALQLAQYLSSDDAIAVFQKYGFLPLKK